MVNVEPGRQTLGLHAIVKPMVAWIWGATGAPGRWRRWPVLVPARRRGEQPSRGGRLREPPGRRLQPAVNRRVLARRPGPHAAAGRRADGGPRPRPARSARRWSDGRRLRSRCRASAADRPSARPTCAASPPSSNFWATWCVPCIQEHGALVRGAAALEGRVRFVGVVYEDSEENVQEFSHKHGAAIRRWWTTAAAPRSRTGSSACRRRISSTRRDDRRQVRRARSTTRACAAQLRQGGADARERPVLTSGPPRCSRGSPEPTRAPRSRPGRRSTDPRDDRRRAGRPAPERARRSTRPRTRSPPCSAARSARASRSADSPTDAGAQHEAAGPRAARRRLRPRAGARATSRPPTASSSGCSRRCAA